MFFTKHKYYTKSKLALTIALLFLDNLSKYLLARATFLTVSACPQVGTIWSDFWVGTSTLFFKFFFEFWSPFLSICKASTKKLFKNVFLHVYFSDKMFNLYCLGRSLILGKLSSSFFHFCVFPKTPCYEDEFLGNPLEKVSSDCDIQSIFTFFQKINNRYQD